MSAEASLTPEQTRALFDILTHHETYAEIEAFKYPDAVTSYGYPFKSVTRIPLASRSGTSTPWYSAPTTPRSRSPMPPEDGKEDGDGDGEGDDDEVQTSTSPVLQTLFTRFALHLPWLRDLPRDFWSVRVQGLLGRLAGDDLSESYDKGALGLRKTLATGASAIIEMVGRGVLGGVKKCTDNDAKRDEYDHSKAGDLERAWDDIVQELVYGDLVEGLFAHMSRTDDFEGYSPAIKAASEFAIVHLATFMHHIFAVSPEGQYLLQLLQNVHNLIPYKMAKQTLRIGNAATMINGMVRLMLAKLSVGGITNWIGLTTNAEDGMNLLQRIISLVLSWDAAEFRKSADRVEKLRGEEKPDEEVLQAIRQFISDEERLQQDAVRATSLEQSQSIIAAILSRSDPELAVALSEEQHAQSLEYYSALLSVHDRDAITAVLCRQQPDLFTQMIREIVNSYEPFIRMLHQGVDLREYLESAQGFIDDFIKASRPKPAGGVRAAMNGETRAPSVEDYVELLRKNRRLMYRWINVVASNCPEVWAELEAWAKMAAVKFRPSGETDETTMKSALDVAADGTNEVESKVMEARLNDLFQSLPKSSRAPVLAALNSHAAHLSELTKLSHHHLQRILDSTTNASAGSGSQLGPGIYLSRWQVLLDESDITPELPVGPVRKGRDVKHTLTLGKSSIVGPKEETSAEMPLERGPPPPDVSIVIKELGQGFVKILQEIGGPDT